MTAITLWRTGLHQLKAKSGEGDRRTIRMSAINTPQAITNQPANISEVRLARCAKNLSDGALSQAAPCQLRSRSRKEHQGWPDSNHGCWL